MTIVGFEMNEAVTECSNPGTTAILPGIILCTFKIRPQDTFRSPLDHLIPSYFNKKRISELNDS